MKRAVWLVLAVACSGKSDPQATSTGSAPPPPTAPALDPCAVGSRALAGATCPRESDLAGLKRATQQFEAIAGTIAKSGVGDKRQVQVTCAALIVGLERDAAKLGCKLATTADDSAQLHAFLDAWFAERTPVPMKGDTPDDDVIERMAKLRDEVCECRDWACIERVEKKLDSAGTLGSAATQAMRDLAGKLIDDMSRCSTRVRITATDSPPTTP